MQYPEHHPLHRHTQRHPQGDRENDAKVSGADKWNTKPGTDPEKIRRYNSMVAMSKGNAAYFANHEDEYRELLELAGQIFYQPDEWPQFFPELYSKDREGKQERK